MFAGHARKGTGIAWRIRLCACINLASLSLSLSLSFSLFLSLSLSLSLAEMPYTHFALTSSYIAEGALGEVYILNSTLYSDFT